MLDFNDMTKLQIRTMVDFAKGYSTKNLAKKYNCCRGTIISRLKRIYKNNPEIFNNALSVRHARQRYRFNLQHPRVLDKHLTRYI